MKENMNTTNETVWVDDSLTLCGKEIPVKLGKLPQADLKFYPENPRVFSIVHTGNAEPSQQTIEKQLGAMDHVKQLVQSIRANSGLTDPLIVRDGDYVVLEGNSRLAAYRLLARNNAIKWGMVKCKLLPKTISDDSIFTLLGEYHIIGKKDWAPYEQAGYLHRRNKVHKVEPSTMANEMGLSTQAVSHMIDVYAFMVEHEDNDVSRWSYYDEYLKHRSIKKARQSFPELDEVVVSKIKSKEISKAVDIRDKLTKIAVAGKKVVKPFIEDNITFEKSYYKAIAKGAANPWYKRLNRFRTMLTEADVEEDFKAMSSNHLNKCLYELNKIKQAIDTLVGRMK